MENKLFELVESTAPNLLLPNLQKLTVIVPIFSRQELIFRQIAHWHGTGSKLIIIDGSETKLDSNSVKFISSFSNVNYLYIKKAFCTRLNIVTKFINNDHSLIRIIFNLVKSVAESVATTPYLTPFGAVIARKI